MIREKEIIIDLSTKDNGVTEFSNSALRWGFKSFLCEETPANLKDQTGVTIYSPRDDADILLLTENNIELIKDEQKRRFAVCLNIEKKKDEEKVINASKLGAESVLIETKDWRIIPLENLIAKLHQEETRLLVWIKNIDEVETMFNILELGVDGIVFLPKKIEDIEELAYALKLPVGIELLPASIIEIKAVGVGDRVCIDTASILKNDEGMLIGSGSTVLFFILGETIESKFSAPRPFRVNAGPVHNYVLLPDGKTQYLIELMGGSEILLIDSIGVPRKAIVGRVKVEKRPLTLVKVKLGEIIGHILVQNAETIRFMNPSGEGISVKDLKIGDEILVHLSEEVGRHFGIGVKEFIIEK